MVVFLSIIWCKFQEFKLHGFREIKFFLGGCFFMPHPVHDTWQIMEWNISIQESQIYND